MNTIGELLSRDLDRKIEEIIQVDQADEQSVHGEITEYIATSSIRDQYAQLLKAIAEAPSEQLEGIGVWISGFFGSGKSSFAKNLGYALQNRKVLGEDFAQLFKQQMGDDQISNFLDSITTRIPRASAILHELDRVTYPSADSRYLNWSKATSRTKNALISMILVSASKAMQTIKAGRYELPRSSACWNLSVTSLALRRILLHSWSIPWASLHR